jgi:hypothetical protein
MSGAVNLDEPADIASNRSYCAVAIFKRMLPWVEMRNHEMRNQMSAH